MPVKRYIGVRRHLGKVLAGAAVAVTGTAVAIGVTLPGSAGADESGGGTAAGQDPAAVQPATVEPAPTEGARGTGRDPLTDDETARAEKIALTGKLTTESENAQGWRGPQLLGVDLAEPDPDNDAAGAARGADVTFYDYRDDTLVTRTVDLDTGTVERSSAQHGVQPPLSQAEMTEAAALLIADPLGAGLKADFKDATGNALTSPGQLILNSMTYRAVPGVRPASLAQCGQHRCVRLFPKVKNGPWIDSSKLIVDLSARTVAALG
ncbi:hypothetical protein OK074_6081 [Actinobacteria bacterium OK074]|nr:hypothetical protein OK074_6081 [Actinobacteria bacterium OK074]